MVVIQVTNFRSLENLSLYFLNLIARDTINRKLYIWQIFKKEIVNLLRSILSRRTRLELSDSPIYSDHDVKQNPKYVSLKRSFLEQLKSFSKMNLSAHKSRQTA